MLDISSSSGRWRPFVKTIVSFLEADTIDLVIDGQAVTGYRSPDSKALWIRDHSDILRGGKYVIEDVQSAVDCFATAQASNGRIFDYVTTIPEKVPGERENWEKWVRVPVEADVEYRFVKAAYIAWQASGDDAWIERLMPQLERALLYTMRHPYRWSREHSLVKRPYTIDTWDFDYTAGRHPWLNFEINEHTFWGITHGDNSGFAEACVLLGRLYAHLGLEHEARFWTKNGLGVRKRANQLLFNGSFYTHFHKLTPVTIEGVDEEAQLSLSNAMNINRGMATPEIARAVLDEYLSRRASSGHFAEWYSIDPPFPDGIFGDETIVAGAYCNGGIMPLVGGEIARAALESGREAYGVATLDQYRKMIEASGETYLWYFPDGTASSIETSTSPDAMPTDGWGSSSMLYAFVEGLCGIEDTSRMFRTVRCCPRWPAAGETDVSVHVGYPASSAQFGYEYRHEPDEKRISLSLRSPESSVDMHVLLPEGVTSAQVILEGDQIESKIDRVDESLYVDFRVFVEGGADVEVSYRNDQ